MSSYASVEKLESAHVFELKVALVPSSIHSLCSVFMQRRLVCLFAFSDCAGS